MKPLNSFSISDRPTRVLPSPADKVALSSYSAATADASPLLNASFQDAFKPATTVRTLGSAADTGPESARAQMQEVKKRSGMLFMFTPGRNFLTTPMSR